MTLVREPGSEILAQFTVPTRGTWLNTAINSVPLDAVYNSHNIFVREGKLRSRPGLLLFPVTIISFSDTLNDTIIGGAFGVTLTKKYVVAPSYNVLFIYDDVSDQWQTVPFNPSTETFANGETSVVDVAFIEAIGTYNALFASEGRVLKTWSTNLTPSINEVTVVTGTNIPTAKSICIAASRVIALIPPHTVVWSRSLNFTNFDALAIVKRAQTPDGGICVRSLSALSFVLYKEQSIHTARAQAGLDEGSAFSFAEPIIAEGPAGIYAVTTVNGVHVYMTKSGRIAIFDGTNYPEWIADGIWFFLQTDIDQTYAYLIRAVYDYRLNIVVFFYPKVGIAPDLTGMVIINLPFPGFESQEGLLPYSFLGTCQKKISHALSKRFDSEIDNGLIFQKRDVSDIITAPLSHTFGENQESDNGTVFTCSFQTGLQAAPDARHVQTTTESFLERGIGYGTVSLAPVTSNTLETKAGTIHTADAQTIDLTVTPINEYIGFNKKTRFFGFQYSWVSTSNVFYSGTVVYDSVKRRQ